MTETALMCIPAGDITWSGLLDGFIGSAIAIPLAFWAAWYAFKLQRDHSAESALEQAVEELRAQLLVLAGVWEAIDAGSIDEPAFGEEMALTTNVTIAASRARSRCGKDDAALRQGIREAIDEITVGMTARDVDAVVLAAAFTTAWLDDRDEVRSRKVTVAALKPAVAQNNAQIRKLAPVLASLTRPRPQAAAGPEPLEGTEPGPGGRTGNYE